MGGISSGVGLFSGINSGQLIDQLIAASSRPKQLAQARLQQFQFQQAAYLDINARIAALRTSAASFRENKTFQTKTAVSSNTDVLSATASTDAASGSYVFVVDRLVSTQQQLSRGFANKDVSGLGGSTITLESAKARLDRDVELADLNNGEGVSRGRIQITDSGGRTATVDLSRSTTVGEVLEAINSNGTAQVTASISGGKFVVKDNAGGSFSITNAQGSTTATGLGLAGVAASGGTITGSTVYALNSATTLASLNDGVGVSRKPSTTEDSYNFVINVGGASPAAVKVNIGDVYQTVSGTLTKVKGAVSDMGGVVTRINEALTAAGATGVSASIDSTNGRLLITDTTGTKPLTVSEGTDTTAKDLGLLTDPVSGNIVGRRVLAGLQTTLVRGLKGGTSGTNSGLIHFTLRDGSTFDATIDPNGGVSDALKAIEDASVSSGSKRLTATLDSRGTGIVITDLTSGTGKLIITGASGSDAAAALGISTGTDGVSASVVNSGNLQRQYIGRATALSSLNNGKGIGNGDFRITDSFGTSANVSVTDSLKTIGDLVDLINSRGVKVKAQINANGDGISIAESLADGETAGAQKIKIEEVGGGSMARTLNLLGEASGTGGSNSINGSWERTITLTAADTLQQVADKINAAKANVTAAIVRDGSGSAPFRLSLTSSQSGRAGRMILDSGSLDLGLTTLDAGRDARVFFGSSDAAAGVAVTSSTNTIDNILSGVKIDLKGTSASPVTLNVATDTDNIEKAIGTFISTFNTAISRIEFQSDYDKDSGKKGPLLGDATTLQLRTLLFSTIQGTAKGVSGNYQSFADVGVTIGSGGTLQLDSGKLRAAMAADPTGVESLFTARVTADDSVIDLGGGVKVRNQNSGNTFSSLGIMGQMEQLAKRYVDGSSAILFGRGDELRNQVKAQQSRIDAMDDQLAQKRDILQRQFLAMEKAIGQMQTQQSALGSIGRAG
ncbi:MAG: flagellar filament capping protein FliD [Planctomycetes bacterium]|nr:flagellar filament capping protein FliD [Planctomycetota bacterium]